MVEVRVAEDDGVERSRVERRLGPVPQAELLEPLKEPTVKQDLAATGAQEVPGARNGARPAEELQASW